MVDSRDHFKYKKCWPKHEDVKKIDECEEECLLMSTGLTGDGYSQVHSLTFVDEVGLDYGGDTQGIVDYVYDEFTLPSQTQATQSQASQQQQPPPG